eukprot:577302-Rhodomonas_salina.1
MWLEGCDFFRGGGRRAELLQLDTVYAYTRVWVSTGAVRYAYGAVPASRDTRSYTYRGTRKRSRRARTRRSTSTVPREWAGTNCPPRHRCCCKLLRGLTGHGVRGVQRAGGGVCVSGMAARVQPTGRPTPRQGTLWAYAFATQCPAMLLPGTPAGLRPQLVGTPFPLCCYAMSGTDLGYAATRHAMEAALRQGGF